MKEKADTGSASFIVEEKNSFLGLNTIYAGFVVIIQLVIHGFFFSAQCNRTFL